MVDKAKVSQVVDELKVALQSHGGDIELIEVTDDGVVKVSLQGACRGCPAAATTLERGVEARLRQEIPEITEVVNVE